jgi:hypothetical protein
MGLVALGALILVVTPSRQHAPIAITATTSPAVMSDAPIIAGVRGTLTDAADRITHATPVGDGTLAVTTRAATPATIGHIIDVVVPSGEIVAGVVVLDTEDTVVVRLSEPMPAHPIAEQHPVSHAIVRVLSHPPVDVPLSELAGLDVDEGTAVLDASGDLVGLCGHDESGDARLVAVSEGLVAATSDGR